MPGRPPGARSWKAIEPLWQQVSTSQEPDVFLARLARFPFELGRLFAARWCVCEVHNGGFHQFFTNPTGVLAPEAAAGFELIGLADCAETVRHAMVFFGDRYPRDQKIRQTLLSRMSEERNPFRALDDDFFAATQDERFERASDAYVEAHPA
ncbi:MAG: DUF4375 domain-containing protein [Candidatus Eremiobacterota bacterium]